MNVEDKPFFRSYFPHRDKASPWLGLVDISGAFIFAKVSLVVFIVPMMLTGRSLKMTTVAGICLALGAQLVSAVSPYVVTKFGIGPVRKWHVRFEKADILRGFGFAFLLLGVIFISNSVGVRLFDLEPEEISNTRVLTDVKETSWFLSALVVIIVVVGAPFSEELVYRGLMLRVFERIGAHLTSKYARFAFLQRYGAQLLAVIAPALLFALMHAPTPPDGQEVKQEALYVVWFSICLIGIGFGCIAIRYKRLGPSIMAHAVFNGTIALNILLSPAT